MKGYLFCTNKTIQVKSYFQTIHIRRDVYNLTFTRDFTFWKKS